MTEKHYGGTSGIPQPKNVEKAKSSASFATAREKNEDLMAEEFAITEEARAKLIKAGEIAREVKTFARELVSKDMLLLEIAEEIEKKIAHLGGKPAFPVNLSINEIAAHATPAHNSADKAHGLLKVDIGVHIDGYVADTALSFDLENNDENKKLIGAAQDALDRALKRTKLGVTIGEIGKEIHDTIVSYGLQPIRNLSGHSLRQYELHAGITIPNNDTGQNIALGEGAYAIEPFATSGAGMVQDGRPSGIYVIERDGAVRDSFAREVLNYIADEYQTLPFCSRWVVKKFGTRALIALKRLEEARILHQYPQLIEKQRKPVAQAEHTFILTEKETIVTT